MFTARNKDFSSSDTIRSIIGFVLKRLESTFFFFKKNNNNNNNNNNNKSSILFTWNSFGTHLTKISTTVWLSQTHSSKPSSLYEKDLEYLEFYKKKSNTKKNHK